MALLYVIATPIGNRADLSARAAETLTSVDLIVSEKPLSSKKLLDPLGIKTRVLPVFAPGKRFAINPVLAALKSGEDVALISEAGTPGINDPGGVIVAAVRAAGHEVRGVPGANAAVTAASISGFPMDEFIFKGFVPHKKGRETFFNSLAAIESAVIFYESPHRIAKTLTALAEHLPNRYLCVARELTKLHEQSLVATCREVAALTETELPRRGEFVLILAPSGFVPQD
ncbi:MAG: 16S rRNA (cytidine(1402)-2'-O)-methyltransferase [bacterium]|nr:16S rRNA (cytidine(1402)-2'-O)-methyltransferase [bacterium]